MIDLSKLVKFLERKDGLSTSEALLLRAIKDDKYISSMPDQFIDANVTQYINDPDRLYNTQQNSYVTRFTKQVVEDYKGFILLQENPYLSFSEEKKELLEKIGATESKLSELEEVSKSISGLEGLNEYAQKFHDRSEGYLEAATNWRNALFVMYLIFGIVFFFFLFFDFNDVRIVTEFVSMFNSEKKEQLAYGVGVLIKLFVLIILVQAIRFLSRNYFANMNLYTSSLHKADVLQALYEVYKLLPDKEEFRGELIKTGALTAFQESESGYLTTKEGAGSGEISSLAMLLSALKK